MAVARTHRPVWNREACLPCGACTRRCPSRVFPEQAEEPDSLRGRVARKMGPRLLEVPPCQTACPLGQDVPAYVAAVAAGAYPQALEAVLQTNPFPAVCGRLCHHPCQRACVRGKLDTPVRIRALKRLAEERARADVAPARPPERGGRVTVIGAGPAGLSAAWALRRRGRRVTVIDSAPAPGGLLRWAVPGFHLPHEALQADIERILASGVALRTDEPVEGRDGLERLRAEGADALVVATGAGQGRKLEIPGEDRAGCWDAVSFARSYRDGQGPALSGAAVIAGGGYLGAAVARMAIRAGAGPVYLLPGTSRRVASAEPEGVGMAEEEGVEVVLGTRPLEARGDEHLQAVVCTTRDGEREIEAGLLVAARERAPLRDWKPELDPDRGVFGAGEAVTGPRNLVGAVARGVKVAGEVDRYLEGGPR